MKCSIFSLICICCCCICYSRQSSEEDSIKNILQHTAVDSIKANCLFQLGNLFTQTNPKKAINYLEQIFSEHLQLPGSGNRLKAEAGALLSYLYRALGDSASAEKWITTALATTPAVKDVNVLAEVYSEASGLYSLEEQYTRAIEYSQKIIALADSAKLPGKAGLAYINMGNMYFKMSQYAKAVSYYHASLAHAGNVLYSDKETNKKLIVDAYIGLSQVYYESGHNDSAMYYADKGLQLATLINQADDQCTFYQVKATVLQSLGQYKQSLPFARQMLQLARSNNIDYQLPAAYAITAIGYAHINGGKDSAMYYAGLCESMAKKTVYNKEDWVDIYNTWSSVYEGVGDYKKAWEYKQKELDTYKEYRDNEVNKAINQNEIMFETKRKEQEINTLDELTKRQRIIQWAIGAGLAVAVVAATAFWLSYRNKHRAAAILEQSNKEKEIFLKEIHHRVKNNLQIISSLLYLQFKDYKDTNLIAALQQAQQRIKSMALVHNKLYEKQDVVHVYLKEYINDLAAGILASNNPDGKVINISVEEKSNVAFSLDTSISIGLILNEVITNSCKYAFAGRNEGNIQICLEQQEPTRFKLQIADNGSGLPVDFEKRNSLGVRLVKNLARQMGGEANFGGGAGTKVTVLFTENAAA